MSKVKAFKGGFFACMCANPLVITCAGDRLNERTKYCGLCGLQSQLKHIDAAAWQVGGLNNLPKYEDLIKEQQQDD